MPQPEKHEPGTPSSITWIPAAGDPFIEDDAALAALAAALAYGGRPDRAVDVIVVNAATLAGLHGEFLGDATETDVITFDLSDPEDSPGIFRTRWRDLRQRGARTRSCPRQAGIGGARAALYIVHGALHLCGMDDSEAHDRAAMREAEAQVMERLGYPSDDGPHEWTGS